MTKGEKVFEMEKELREFFKDPLNDYRVIRAARGYLYRYFENNGVAVYSMKTKKDGSFVVFEMKVEKPEFVFRFDDKNFYLRTFDVKNNCISVNVSFSLIPDRCGGSKAKDEDWFTTYFSFIFYPSRIKRILQRLKKWGWEVEWY